MPKDSLTPLRFAPIFKPALWGGSRLRAMLGGPPSTELTGEAWVLSDCPDAVSVVADGPLAGTPLHQLVADAPERLLGATPAPQGRFPLLLKFLHARQPLSVQVHPDDRQARDREGPRAVGKTEAWVVLEADPTAILYAGLQPGTTPDRLRRAIMSGQVEDVLYAHAPSPGDCYFLPAGTVHAIGGGLVLFEVQQTSDITYRLYDWGRVDPKTGKPRELHVEKGLACVDYGQGPCRPVSPTEEAHGRARLAPLVDCEHFFLGRWDSPRPFHVGEFNEFRVLIGIGGKARLQHAGVAYPIGLGDVWLVPAEVGVCEVIPDGPAVILECAPGGERSC